MADTTKIGDREVTLLPGENTVTFSGGRKGPVEAGEYCFWTFEPGGVTARRRKGDEAGARFSDIEQQRKTAKSQATREAYAAAWELAQGATLVRPATKIEIIEWLAGHPSDAVFAESAVIDETKYRVEKSAGVGPDRFAYEGVFTRAS